jgi:hypothetical protein
MKKILLLLAGAFVLQSEGHSQTTEEWLNQKATQRKYLLQQIAALHMYIGYAKKGYAIVDKGITTVRNIKKGDFNLHRDFLAALKQVNPKISQYAKVADIIAYQLRIIKQANQVKQHIRETKQFTADEMDYCYMVFDMLLTECVKSIEELMDVISSDKLEMKDSERLQRIDNLYLDMQDKYTFCTVMSEDMALLAAQRMGEQIEIKRSKILNNLK